jgi:hypothetical protein
MTGACKLKGMLVVAPARAGGLLASLDKVISHVANLHHLHVNAPLREQYDPTV